MVIDVKELLARISDAELLESADAYFAALDERSEQVRKPFSNPSDAVNITRHLGIALEAADLFPGAEVLDFGCATGWLTLALASMGCDATGVDIAPSAISLAHQLKSKRWSNDHGKVEFKVYSGKQLPLDDESVDRVICFDAFHHVRNQSETLGELARVLRNGGIAAFLEPGPMHSRTAQSQREMSQYGVIENDIRMEEIAGIAYEVGFTDVEMLVQLSRPVRLPVEEFSKWAKSGLTRDDRSGLIKSFERHLTDTQCFTLRKGRETMDSRQILSLGATLRLLKIVNINPQRKGLAIEIRNTGSGVWINRPGARGHVNLGVQLLAIEGHVKSMDYMRFSLPSAGLQPGAFAEMFIELDCSDEVPMHIRLDMVSEFVTWFGPAGLSNPLDLTL